MEMWMDTEEMKKEALDLLNCNRVQRCLVSCKDAFSSFYITKSSNRRIKWALLCFFLVCEHPMIHEVIIRYSSHI